MSRCSSPRPAPIASSIRTSSPNACWPRGRRTAAAEGLDQAHRRQPDALSALRPARASSRPRWARWTRPAAPPPISGCKTKIEEIRADPRYAFMFSGMLVSDTLRRVPRAHLPPAGLRQADLDRRRVGRAERHHQRRRRGAGADGVRLCDVVARRDAAADPARLRGGAPLHPVRPRHDRLGGARHPGADRQGGPQIRRLARPDHAAPVRSGRGRALAVRHDHHAAAQQRSRPGVRPRGDAGGLARLPRRDPGAAQPRVHRQRRGRVDPDPRLARRSRGEQAPGLERSRCSPICGARPAARRRRSTRWSSGGAARGGNPAPRANPRRCGCGASCRASAAR